jgi:DNA invertase Pin-like site-specific DNA recombinase
MRAIGYVRVSTDEQDFGADAQRHTIKTEAERRNWTIEFVEDIGCSARNLKRPGVVRVLELLRNGEADALIVAKLDRLSRSVLDFTGVMAAAQKEGWALIALDCAVDMTTPAGEAMANVLATFAQFERRLISQRTKEALAVKKANGVKLGRPRSLDEDVRAYIRHQRRHGGFSYQQIARVLNEGGVPTAHGGKKWWPETVRGIVLGEGG